MSNYYQIVKSYSCGCQRACSAFCSILFLEPRGICVLEPTCLPSPLSTHPLIKNAVTGYSEHVKGTYGDYSTPTPCYPIHPTLHYPLFIYVVTGYSEQNKVIGTYRDYPILKTPIIIPAYFFRKNGILISIKSRSVGMCGRMYVCSAFHHGFL